MHVRISPDKGNAKYFEFDVEFSRLTPEIKRATQEVIFKETGIQLEKQNAAFSSEFPDAEDITKLALPSAVKQLAPVPAFQKAQLNTKYPEIFKQSTIYVSRINDWANDDPQKPENRVQIRRIIENAGAFLQTLRSELIRPRTVDTSLLDQFPDFRDGIEQAVPNFLVPTASMSSDSDVTPIELRCYVDIFRSIVRSTAKFDSRKSDSSALHTLYFGSRVIEPPFFLDEHEHRSFEKLEMIADCASRLRMFIRTTVQPEIYKFTPRSDLAVIDKLTSLPALICEVDSHVAKKDRTRMILEGVVACRQWRYVLPETLKEKNRVLALFINDDFVVELYLFHSDENYDVEIFQDGFFFGRREDSLRLSRILFNYRDKFLDIAGLAEQEKGGFLDNLVSDSNVLPSFTTSTRKDTSSRRSRRSSKQPTLATIPETHTVALLLSAEVQSLLCPDGAYLEATEYESVAAVRTVGVSSKTLGFVKLMNKHELRAFDAIRNSGSELLLSRIVLPTKVVEVSGYSVAFLPFGGDALLYSWGLQDGPAGHETEIAWDLLTIISRLHDLHIAHLDIKPTNILWDPSTRSIRVIDFDSSEKLDPNGSRKVKGVSGTSGYAAPEVELEVGHEYDPFLADAFSCGLVLSDVVMSEKMTNEARFVCEISQSLSRADVSERWSINKAIEVWMDRLEKRGDSPDHSDCHLAHKRHLTNGMTPLSPVCVH
ncbi:hypothetical protein ACEPAG_30 [Sanghuangporus baumii]